jgi:hypothetical protein
MTDITKHDPEKKRKSDCGVEGWIYLLIRRHSVGVYDLLKELGKLVSFKVSRRVKLLELNLFNLELQLSWGVK